MTQDQHEALNKAIYKLMDESSYSYGEARVICAHDLGIKL